MHPADIAVAFGVGLCLTGVMVSVIQFIMAWGNRRADRRKGHPESIAAPVLSSKFLDWLTEFVLGPKRLDHEPVYSCTISAVFLVGLFWLLVGPLPNSVIFTLPPASQVILATCLSTGSATCLYGISMGGWLDVWRHLVRLKRGLRGEPLSLPPLDIRRSYRVGASGIPAVFVGLSYYSAILIRDTPAQWTGPQAVFLLFICLGMFFQWLRFLMENRRINQALPMLIEQEVNRQLLASETGTETGEATL